MARPHALPTSAPGRIASRRPAPEQPRTDRRAIIAKVHVAKKQLALSDDNYRDLLRRVTGQDSSAACTDAQLDDLLKEFRRIGFQATRRPMSAKAIVRMIHAVWGDIAPQIEDGSPAALRAFVQRQTRSRLSPDGVTAPEFLDVEGATKVLEGLKGWRARLRRGAERLS